MERVTNDEFVSLKMKIIEMEKFHFDKFLEISFLTEQMCIVSLDGETAFLFVVLFEPRDVQTALEGSQEEFLISAKAKRVSRNVELQKRLYPGASLYCISLLII